MTFLLRSFLISLSVAFALTSNTYATTSQPSSRIAAIVNNDIITISDVDARLNLFILTSGIKNGGDKSKLRPLVLQSLIFERIQHQAAESKGVRVSDESVDDAADKVARNNNSTMAQMEKFFDSQGIPLGAFKEMLRTQIAWVEYIRTQHGHTTQVSEAEIESALDKIKGRSGQSQFSYTEIFLPVDSPANENSVRQNAEKIVQQLRSGANAEMVAQQFSQAPSAKNGGKVTLISEGAIDPAFASALKKAATDSIVGPVRVPGGFIIAKLLQHHFAGEANPMETEVKFIQVEFALNDSVSEEEAAQIKTYIDELQKIQGEAAFKKRVEEIGTKTTAATTKLGQLPPDLMQLVKKTAPGHCLQPIRTEGGVLLIMPCSFKKAEFKLPTHDDVMQMLQEEKVAKQAQRDRMRLYAAAYIEIKDPQAQPSTAKKQDKAKGKAASADTSTPATAAAAA